jgi:hypothetical protein
MVGFQDLPKETVAALDMLLELGLLKDALAATA